MRGWHWWIDVLVDLSHEPPPAAGRSPQEIPALRFPLHPDRFPVLRPAPVSRESQPDAASEWRTALVIRAAALALRSVGAPPRANAKAPTSEPEPPCGHVRRVFDGGGHPPGSPDTGHRSRTLPPCEPTKNPLSSANSQLALYLEVIRLPTVEALWDPWNRGKERSRN